MLGVSTPENLLNPICVYVLAHFRAVIVHSNWATFGVEIKCTFSECIGPSRNLYNSNENSLLAPEVAFNFAVINKPMYKNKSEKDQQIINHW